ncbi:hypothetical protein F4781DRAFT_70298 [Annulohypoxylon bovei var. microspora]|nr:hypothetical protein F4781DRAFT_70298 [Annulohypoxylon bovei var. microspora]
MESPRQDKVTVEEQTDKLNARPFISMDLDQPDMAAHRYNGLLPQRRVKRVIGFDGWMEHWRQQFGNFGFKFHNSRHALNTANAFNLAETSRCALFKEVPNVIADLYLGSEEIEVGLRLAVAETDAWVPTGDLLSSDVPERFTPRQMFSKDRAAIATHRFTVLPVHGGRLHHWSLLIYDDQTRTAMM